MKSFYLAAALFLALMQPHNIAAKNSQPCAARQLAIIENKGQINDQYGTPRNDIRYAVQAPGISVFIGNGQLHYQFIKYTKDTADGGGYTHVFSQQFSFIGGGYNNTTSGEYSAILGGCGNNVTHDYAAAFGHGVASSMSCAFHANNFVAQNIQSYLAGATSNLLQYLVAPASLGFPAGTYIVVTS